LEPQSQFASIAACKQQPNQT